MSILFLPTAAGYIDGVILGGLIGIVTVVYLGIQRFKLGRDGFNRKYNKLGAMG